MTGIVKEEILTRLGELGLRLDAGALRVDPTLLRRSELLATDTLWTLPGPDGRPRALPLPGGSLALTFCQVPVILRAVAGPGVITVTHGEGRRSVTPGDRLDPRTTAALLARRGEITLVEIDLPLRSIAR
jgi:hypothetical protein